MVWYYKFCCSVHYFFERRMKYEDAEIFTFFFMLVLIQLDVFTLLGALGILFHEKTVLFSKYDQLIFFITLCLINYLIAFKKSRYLKYENERLRGLSTLTIIILSYAIFGIVAYSYKSMFFPD
jgi:hypothetical protein